MKNLFTLSLVSLFLVGCIKKTHTGVYKSETISGTTRTIQTFDFRSDGTVVHRRPPAFGLVPYDNTKMGTYKIKGTVIHVSFDGLTEKDIEGKWNQFRIEGDDLIWLKTDKRLTRN